MKEKKHIVQNGERRIFLRFKIARERLEKEAELTKKQLIELDEKIKDLSK